MYNIRVNSIILEIPPETRFVLNSLILDFFDITKRGVTASNNFTVKLTQINQEALEFPSPINTTSQAYTKLFPAEVMLGKNVLSTGSVSIKKTDLVKNEVSLQYQDESRDFYDRLDRKAEDIDFSEFDLPYLLSTFLDLSSVTEGQIWVSKLFQGAINGQEIDPFSNVFTRPLYSVRELLRKFLQNVGFSVDFLSLDRTTEINRLLLTSHADNFIVSDFRQKYEGDKFTDEQVNIDDNDFGALISSEFEDDEITNSVYQYSLNLKGNFTVIGGPATIKFINEDDTNVELSVETISLLPGDQFINFTTPIYNAVTDTKIEIIGEIIFQNVFLYMILNEKDIADIGRDPDPPGWSIGIVATSILNEYHFLGAQNLADITQLDLFRVLWSLYFVKVDINNFENKITFDLFGQESELAAIDITDKLVDAGNIEPAKIFARQNIFAYTNDADSFSDYAQFIFRSDAPIDDPIKEYLRFPFAATKNKEFPVGTAARVEVYNRFNFEEVESRIELTNRLLLVSDVSPFINAVFINLSWGFLFGKYYNTLFSRITGKRQIISMMMTFEEFKNITDVGFVFLRGKGLFFVSKITKFEIGQPVALNLLYLI